MNYIILAAIAILYGFLEQWIKRNGFSDKGYHIFGKISANYHIPMLAMWFLTCHLAGAWWTIGIFAVLEDWSYFRFHPSDELDSLDWVTFGMGGIGWPGKFFIPTTYFLGIGLSVGLYFLDRA